MEMVSIDGHEKRGQRDDDDENRGRRKKFKRDRNACVSVFILLF